MKTWLVVKPQHLEEATQAFHGTGVQLTTEGRPYLGIPPGTDTFKEHFTEQKFATWKAELTVLSDAARHQPHAAFAAFTHGVRHKWSYYLRSTECGANQLSALDEAVGSMFLPAITGQPSVARHHRFLLSIPARLGGIGLTLPSRLSKQQREASLDVTQQQVALILSARETYHIDHAAVHTAKKAAQQARASQEEECLRQVIPSLALSEKRMLEATQDRGASAWLSCLPVAEHGFSLSRQCFLDALALRYGWSPLDLPDNCACGSPFSVAHAMSCLTGGYAVLRHNHVCDYLATQVQSVCPAVDTEPRLLALPDHPDEACLDLKVRGFWRVTQDAFFDVRVFYPCASSYLSKSLSSTFRQHEQAKKARYGDRVLHHEQGVFTPLVLSSVGGLGQEAMAFLRRLAAMMHQKSPGTSYSQLMGKLRCELSFSLLRDSLMMLRGSQRKFRFGFQPTDVVSAEALVPSLP